MEFVFFVIKKLVLPFYLKRQHEKEQREIIKNKPSKRNFTAKQINPANAIRNRRITVGSNVATEVFQEINTVSDNRQNNNNNRLSRFEEQNEEYNRVQNNVRDTYNNEWGGFDNQMRNAFGRNVRFHEDSFYD